MKSLDRMYSKLPPDAAASIVWSLLAIDSIEATKVVDGVIHEQSAAIGRRFIQKLGQLHNFALVWGLTHWRLTATKNRTLAGLALAESESELEIVEVGSWWLQAECQLMACDSALESMAVLHGLDADMVRGVVQAERFIPTHPLAKCDQGFTDALLAAFTPVVA